MAGHISFNGTIIKNTPIESVTVTREMRDDRLLNYYKTYTNDPFEVIISYL